MVRLKFRGRGSPPTFRTFLYLFYYSISIGCDPLIIHCPYFSWKIYLSEFLPFDRATSFRLAIVSSLTVFEIETCKDPWRIRRGFKGEYFGDLVF